MSLYFQMDKNEEYELNTEDDYKKIAKSAYKSAVEFYIISIKCLDMMLSEYSSQVCSNIAFSCELFFKSILYYNKIECKNMHNLYQLYNLLPDKDKNDVKKLHKSGNIKKEDFELNLKEIGKAFIVFRYSYERKGMACNLRFLVELIMALNEYCMDIFESKK